MPRPLCLTPESARSFDALLRSALEDSLRGSLEDEPWYQATFGVTYDFDKFTVGTGVQYVDREVSGVALGIPTTLDQKATSVFVQGGFKF